MYMVEAIHSPQSKTVKAKVCEHSGVKSKKVQLPVRDNIAMFVSTAKNQHFLYQEAAAEGPIEREKISKNVHFSICGKIVQPQVDAFSVHFFIF